MKIIEIKENNYVLQADTTHIIHVNEGHFVFPIVDNLCKIKIIFSLDGRYELSALGSKFKIGNSIHKKVIFNCGCPMYGVDTQPSFIYSTESKVWHIICHGNIEYTEEV